MRKQILLLIIICLSLIFIWFHKGLIFAGGEEEIPFYNLDTTMNLYSSSWKDTGTGFPGGDEINRVPFFISLKFLYDRGIPGYIDQAVLFFTLMMVGVISVYLLIYESVGRELKDKYPYLPFSGAVFYLLNPFSMIQVWGRGLYMQFFPFAYIPLFLWLFILGVKKKSFKYIFFISLANFLLAGTYGNLSYVTSSWLIVFMYSFWYFWDHKNKADRIFVVVFFILSLLGWFITNIWWILPYLNTTSDLAAALGQLEQNLGSLIGVSRALPISGVLRLLHNGFLYKAEIYGPIYSNFLFVLISFIPLFLLVISVPEFKKLKSFKFYITLLIFTLFMSFGANPPLGWLYKWFFTHISFMQIYRSPYEKIGIDLMLAYSVFFSLGISMVAKKLKGLAGGEKKVVFVILFLVSGVYCWPMWKGIFAGGVKITTWVKVPDYYREADDWFNAQPGDFRILHMPINPGDGVRLEWEYPFQGSDPSEYLFTKSSLAKNVTYNKIYYNILLERFGKLFKGAYGPDPDISKSDFKQESFIKELSELAIKYIVLHHDENTMISSMKTVDETINDLNKEKGIKKLKTIGKLDIYSVDIPQNISLVYSPDTLTSFIKLSPDHYKIDVKDAKGLTNIYFLNLFNSNWELFKDGSVVDTHGRIYSYANSWKVTGRGDYSLELKYKPQNYVNLGMKISVVYLLIFALFVEGREIMGKLHLFKKQRKSKIAS
ncbi:MAG TPA: hypothetical protein VF189_02345 [Patescibacteria group bacterium]